MTTRKVSPTKLQLTIAGPPTEVSDVFIQGMVNRMLVSYHRYGAVADSFGKIDNPASAWQRMAKYHQTGNSEFLIDAANFLMMEFMKAGPEAFQAQDHDQSPGRTRTDGTVDDGSNK